MNKKKINWSDELKQSGKVAVKGSLTIVKVFLNILITVLLICALTGIIVATAFTVYIKNYVNTSVDISRFRVNTASGTTTSRLYYYDFRDASLQAKGIDEFEARQNRLGVIKEVDGERIVGASDQIYVTYDRIPDNMINAVIAIEDKRFLTHEGVDWKRTFGAALGFFLGGDSYGGSTLTQQLVKNITEQDDYSIQRKVQEIFLALDLETKMDKEQILELYLNIVNFGGNYYGVEAAAKNYFNKDISELSLLECAAIAGITQNPSKFNPRIYPENNKERRNIVLTEMFNQGLITQREYEEAYDRELHLYTGEEDEELTEQQKEGINSWYTDMVINDVIADLMKEKGMSRPVASMMVYNGGLNIYSLEDPEIQTLVEQVYLNDDNFREKGAQSACMVMDPYTGDILGVAGARGKKIANRIQNYATDTKRPSGSAIKPLSVYAPLIDSGELTWATVTDDTPFNFTDNELGWPKNDENWSATGYYTTVGNRYRGLETTAFAVAYSTNTVPVKLLDFFGLRNSFNFCREKLHMTDLIESQKTINGATITDIGYSALALGQLNYGISVRQLTAAYTTFPNRGICNEAHSYAKVTTAEGTTLLENNITGTVAISEGAACVMNHLLEGVTHRGTASVAWLGANGGLTFPSLHSDISVAGKTGSAGDNYDRWFVGYTPYYLCGVWTGYEYNNKTITVANPSLKVFDAVMNPLHEDRDSAEFFASPNVVECEYCKDSGMLEGDNCRLDPRQVTDSRMESGWFIDGTQPTKKCDKHILVDYDYVSGGVCLAGACPEGETRQVALVRVFRDFNTPRDITIMDAQYTYMDLPAGMAPCSNTFYPFYYSISLAGPEWVSTPDRGSVRVYHKTGYTVGVTKAFNAYCTVHTQPATVLRVSRPDLSVSLLPVPAALQLNNTMKYGAIPPKEVFSAPRRLPIAN